MGDIGETGEMRARVIRGCDGGYGERSVVAVEYPGLWAQETFLEDHREQGGGLGAERIYHWSHLYPFELDPGTTAHIYRLVQTNGRYASCKPSHSDLRPEA